MALHEELERLLRQTGAALVGFADLRNVAASPCPTGVSVAIPLPPQILRQLKTAPTREYYDMYYAWNVRLDTIVRTGAQYLQSRGFYAKACTVDSIHKDQNALTPLPHKTVATHAGLGWIGKSCLLVTPEYGSAVRISTILTDAELPYAEPITASRCGKCTQCQKNCPAQAIHGTLWQAGMDRAEILDWQRCEQTELRIMKEHLGIPEALCGKCFAVCPYTLRYLRRDYPGFCQAEA